MGSPHVREVFSFVARRLLCVLGMHCEARSSDGPPTNGRQTRWEVRVAIHASVFVSVCGKRREQEQRTATRKTGPVVEPHASRTCKVGSYLGKDGVSERDYEYILYREPEHASCIVHAARGRDHTRHRSTRARAPDRPHATAPLLSHLHPAPMPMAPRGIPKQLWLLPDPTAAERSYHNHIPTPAATALMVSGLFHSCSITPVHAPSNAPMALTG